MEDGFQSLKQTLRAARNGFQRGERGGGVFMEKQFSGCLTSKSLLSI